MTFTGRSVLITGGASGIGYATAALFVEQGARVVIADINEGGLATAVETLNTAGYGQVFGVPCDTADPDSCTRLVEYAIRHLGTLNVVCNVAGVLSIGPTGSFTDEMWHKVVGVNLNGPFYISKRALPHLLETRGCIVNVASTAALVGIPYGAAYSATKTGLIGLTKALAVEYSRAGVRINAVCPGHVLTPMTAGDTVPGPGADLDLLSRLAPLTGQGSEPSEIAAAIAYLASDAATNVTGATLTIDGGQTAI